MTTSRASRAYGLWSSPIGADVILGGARLGDVAWDADSGQLVWSESSEGHGVLFAADPNGSGDAPRQLTTGLNVRGRLGYGGGEFTVAGGHVYFAADEGRLYRQSLSVNDSTPITPAFGAAAAPVVHPGGSLVAYVHSVDDIDRIALVDSAGKSWPHILAQGHDFYMHPAWHPSGTMFAYVTWDFPDMPWDRSQLHIARFDESAPSGPSLYDSRIVAGSSATAGPDDADRDDLSVMQPTFSPDGRLLVYISDATGFWQLYAYDVQADEHIQLTDAPFEHGVPAWVHGQRTYAFAPDGRSIFYIRNEKGYHRLLRCTLYDDAGDVHPRSEEVHGDFSEYGVMTQIAIAPSGVVTDVPSATSSTDDTSASRASSSPFAGVAFIGEGPNVPARIVVATVDAGATDGPAAAATADEAPLAPRVHVIRRSQAENFVPGILSRPEPITWQATDGTPVHGLYYPPTNPHFDGDGAPPAVISIHGGPTAQSLPEFNGKAQFFTSRGYAYVEPNYRGSTGFGRAYRNMLHGNWGVADVEDALDSAQWLVDNGHADSNRLIIMGGSAGGYTALRALIERPGFFKAAINMYGVADLFGLAMDTHKFERHYTDRLVGPLPEAAPLYRDRSPVFHAHLINDPVAVFQGTADNVVPKSQSDAIVAALQRSGTPCEYHVYEGAGHGWRQPETVEAVYDAIDKFLQRYVIFT